MPLSAIVAKVKLAVVRIESSAGIGTGFIIDPVGWIVTNAHVVSDDLLVEVTLHDGATRFGWVIGNKPEEDIALIRVDGINMPTLALRSPLETAVGQDVIALGYALDLPGQPTLTRGVISALRPDFFGSISAIQTDTALNPGNSGGPLMDLEGNVLGINSSTYRETEGLNLAINMDDARQVIDALKSGEVMPLGRYVSNQYPFSVRIPDGWQVYELLTSYMLIMDSGSTGQVHIMIESVDSNVSNDQFAQEQTLAGVAQDFEYYEKVANEEIIISSSIPAWAVTEVWKNQGYDFAHQGREIFFTYQGLGYSIYTQSETVEWETLEGTIDSILESLRVEQPRATPLPTAVPVATATAVPTVAANLSWMERYMKSPGYNSEWGQPKSGGTFVFGTNRDTTDFNPTTIGGCYVHGCHAELAYNSLFRIDPWVGLSTFEGDIAKSWEMAGDGRTLIIQLQQGVRFYANPNSNVPAEFNGGQIAGDELVCEDIQATFDRMANPPDWEKPIMGTTRSMFSHLKSTTCPDGPRGYTVVLNFDPALARTLNMMSRGLAMLDKDFIEWLHAKGTNYMREGSPDNFNSITGTGAFMPVEINVGRVATWERNPDYWREGLPLLDKYKNIVIKDPSTRFTALATGQIDFYGEGSYSFTAGQAEQAIRDFPDRITVGYQMNMWARVIYFNVAKPPFDDWRVRQAVHLALDREAWKAFRRVGVGKRSIEGTQMAYTLPPGTFFAASNAEVMTWPGWRQPKDADIAEANRLLDEVFGPGERPAIKCLAPTPQQSDIDGCLFVMDQLRKNLNLNATSDFLDTTAAYDKRVGGTFTLTVGSGSMSTQTGDPDDSYFTTFICKPGGSLGTCFTFTEYGITPSVAALWAEKPVEMAKFEDMVWEQSRTMDLQARRAKVRAMEDYLRTEVVSLHTMLGWTNIFPAWGINVKGIVSYDLWSYTKGAMWERVWKTN